MPAQVLPDITAASSDVTFQGVNCFGVAADLTDSLETWNLPANQRLRRQSVKDMTIPEQDASYTEVSRFWKNVVSIYCVLCPLLLLLPTEAHEKFKDYADPAGGDRAKALYRVLVAITIFLTHLVEQYFPDSAAYLLDDTTPANATSIALSILEYYELDSENLMTLALKYLDASANDMFVPQDGFKRSMAKWLTTKRLGHSMQRSLYFRYITDSFIFKHATEYIPFAKWIGNVIFPSAHFSSEETGAFKQCESYSSFFLQFSKICKAKTQQYLKEQLHQGTNDRSFALKPAYGSQTDGRVSTYMSPAGEPILHGGYRPDSNRSDVVTSKGFKAKCYACGKLGHLPGWSKCEKFDQEKYDAYMSKQKSVQKDVKGPKSKKQKRAPVDCRNKTCTTPNCRFTHKSGQQQTKTQQAPAVSAPAVSPEMTQAIAQAVAAAMIQLQPKTFAAAAAPAATAPAFHE